MNYLCAVLLCAALVYFPFSAAADQFCWKDDSSRRECVKITWPSQECVFLLSLLVQGIDDFDMDGDGKLSVNDLGLVVSKIQREAEGACGD